MVTSRERKDWVEDSVEQHRREEIAACTLPHIMRQLYPYKARILRIAMFRELVGPGDIIEYARVKHTPAFYPIEAVMFDKAGVRKNFFLNSDEAEVLEA
jgi:hypothetical protein